MLDNDSCVTFLKFLKIAYGLATVKFKQQKAVDLFNKINKFLFENIPLKK